MKKNVSIFYLISILTIFSVTVWFVSSVNADDNISYTSQLKVKNWNMFGTVTNLDSNKITLQDENQAGYIIDLSKVRKIENKNYDLLTISDIGVGDSIIVQGIIDGDIINARRVISVSRFATTTLATTTDMFATSTATTTEEVSTTTEEFATSTDIIIEEVATSTDTTSTTTDTFATTTEEVATTTEDIATTTEEVATTTEEIATSTATSTIIDIISSSTQEVSNFISDLIDTITGSSTEESATETEDVVSTTTEEIDLQASTTPIIN